MTFRELYFDINFHQLSREYEQELLYNIKEHEASGAITKAEKCLIEAISTDTMTSATAKVAVEFYFSKYKHLSFPEDLLHKFELCLPSETTLNPQLKQIYTHLLKRHLETYNHEKCDVYIVKLGKELSAADLILLKAKVALKSNPGSIMETWRHLMLRMELTPDDARIQKLAAKIVTTTDISTRPDFSVPKNYKQTPELFCQYLSLKWAPEYIRYVSKEEFIGKQLIPHTFEEGKITLLSIKTDEPSRYGLTDPDLSKDPATSAISDPATHYEEQFKKGNKSTQLLIDAAMHFYNSKNFNKALFYLKQLESKDLLDKRLANLFSNQKNKIRLKNNSTPKVISEKCVLMTAEILLCDDNPDKDFVEGWNKLMNYIDMPSISYPLKAQLIASDFLTRHPSFLVNTIDSIIPKCHSEIPKHELIHHFFEQMRIQLEEKRIEDASLSENKRGFLEQKNKVYSQIVNFYLDESTYDESRYMNYLFLLPGTLTEKRVSS